MTNSCSICARPQPDTATVCTDCANGTARSLERAIALVDEADATIAKLARIGASSSRQPEPPEPDGSAPGGGHLPPWLRSQAASALYPTPLPYNPSAADRYAAAGNAIVTAVRHIAEERGILVPRTCAHHSCGRIRIGHTTGPTCEYPAGTRQLVKAMTWLLGQLNWLRHRPEAVEELRGLDSAAGALVRLVDRPPSRVVIGQCACNEYLYAIKGAAFVKCQGCGTSYDVATVRDMMRTWLGDALFTAAECATMAALLGLTANRTRTRHLITIWGDRGRLVVHDYQGVSAYRFGEVVDRLAASKPAG